MAEINSTKRSPKFKDLTGREFDKWTVLEFHSRTNGSTKWLCRCECGKEKPVTAGALRSGKSRSCKSCANFRHGKINAPEYNSWKNMIGRCRNPAATGYDRYGGRGITVCERWMKIENFLADMGTRPSPRHSIERINNNLGYFPKNCYWATPKQQSRNTRCNRLLTFNGKTMCMKEWEEETGIAWHAIRNRLNSGWSVEQILTTPARGYKRTS